MSVASLVESLESCADILEQRAWIDGDACPFCAVRDLQWNEDASHAFWECQIAIRTVEKANRDCPDALQQSAINQAVENLQHTFWGRAIKRVGPFLQWNPPVSSGVPRPWVNRSEVSGLRQLAKRFRPSPSMVSQSTASEPASVQHVPHDATQNPQANGSGEYGTTDVVAENFAIEPIVELPDVATDSPAAEPRAVSYDKPNFTGAWKHLYDYLWHMNFDLSQVQADYKVAFVSYRATFAKKQKRRDKRRMLAHRMPTDSDAKSIRQGYRRQFEVHNGSE